MASPATAALGAIMRGSATPEAALAKAQEQVTAAIAGLQRARRDEGGEVDRAPPKDLCLARPPDETGVHLDPRVAQNP